MGKQSELFIRYPCITYVWLEDNPTLTAESKKIISNPNNLVFVSPVSTWEITIKKAVGKLDAPDNLEQVI